jgi:hypothetical protein
VYNRDLHGIGDCNCRKLAVESKSEGGCGSVRVVDLI